MQGLFSYLGNMNTALHRLLDARYGAVLSENPHPDSRPAFLLLKRELATLEGQDDPKMNPFRWLPFRLEVLTERVNPDGSWTCLYCKRTDLCEVTDNVRRLVTLDHVVPHTKGGAIYDRSNLVVACAHCNYKKSNKTV